MDASEIFDASQLEEELTAARDAGRAMLSNALAFLTKDGILRHNDLPYLGFIERAQAFHLGTISLVQQGNPLGAVTLLRAYAENLAVAYWISKKPAEFEKLRPGAVGGLPIGKVIAEANRNLPGFKALYDLWSSHAHPSGAGGFHTLRVTPDHQISWQSHPTFNSIADARQVLQWLDSVCALTTRVIAQTANDRLSQRPAH